MDFSYSCDSTVEEYFLRNTTTSATTTGWGRGVGERLAQEGKINSRATHLRRNEARHNFCGTRDLANYNSKTAWNKLTFFLNFFFILSILTVT